ncbi:MAG: hypothetical protein IJ627_03165 [Bacteroidales bacterium]|nr:hypothetical protein [Bacteroidales bacterium]
MSSDNNNLTTAALLWEYEGRRMEAQDVRAQNEACREYFKDTSPAAWSYEGWLDYWETSSRNVLPGAPSAYMRINEERFNELRREAAVAQGVEAPAASAPRREKAADFAVDAATVMDAALTRERASLKAKILQSEWPAGLTISEDSAAPFIWYGTLNGLAALLKDFLPSSNGKKVPTDFGHKELKETELYRWDIAEGLFLWKGKLVTAEQLRNAERRTASD